MTSFIDGLSHVDIHVPDVDAALRFYCEGLGLTLKRRDSHNGIVETPDGVILELSPGGEPEGDQSGITHVCYNTFDVDAAFRRALEYGARISRPQDPEPYTYQNLRMAFVRAPSGEEIEFWSVRHGGTFGEAGREGRYIKHFVHTALTVPDMHGCVRFYEGLGARLKTDWEWGCSVTLPDNRELELFTGGSYARESRGYRHLCLITADVDTVAKRVQELGGEIAHEPYDWSNLRICFCRGLAGEVIEFFQFYQDGRQSDVFERPPAPLPDLFADKEA
ncbi:MAG: VOC family protein [Treponema sp.]|jgi:catechol 2,3-dioxygenase-like lactoylglutathione lyase family enzyme|nr:VOC family protein [Treponema sp.]